MRAYRHAMASLGPVLRLVHLGLLGLVHVGVAHQLVGVEEVYTRTVGALSRKPADNGPEQGEPTSLRAHAGGPSRKWCRSGWCVGASGRGKGWV